MVETLNTYLDRMVNIILKEQGTIGDFIGDAIMAYFGSPLDQPDHAARACRCALQMQAAMAAVNAGLASRTLPDLRMRIGLHTGSVIVGNIGSERRKDYTIIGDAVNLTSRLEGANKVFGSGIMASQAILALAGDGLKSRELGRLVVQGRFEAVTVFQLFWQRPSEAGAAFKDEPLAEAYEQALSRFHEKKFAQAADDFHALWEKFQDEASRFMGLQCQEFLQNPPPETWQGEVFLTAK